MAKFQKKDASQVRSVRIPILYKEDEATQVRVAAKIRNLTVAEYIRRTSLGRKAEVHFETQTVLVLHHWVQILREMHATYVEKGDPPPEAEMLLVLRTAGAAMLRVGK